MDSIIALAKKVNEINPASSAVMALILNQDPDGLSAHLKQHYAVGQQLAYVDAMMAVAQNNAAIVSVVSPYIGPIIMNRGDDDAQEVDLVLFALERGYLNTLRVFIRDMDEETFNQIMDDERYGDDHKALVLKERIQLTASAAPQRQSIRF